MKSINCAATADLIGVAKHTATSAGMCGARDSADRRLIAGGLSRVETTDARAPGTTAHPPIGAAPKIVVPIAAAPTAHRNIIVAPTRTIRLTVAAPVVGQATDVDQMDRTTTAMAPKAVPPNTADRKGTATNIAARQPDPATGADRTALLLIAGRHQIARATKALRNDPPLMNRHPRPRAR